MRSLVLGDLTLLLFALPTYAQIVGVSGNPAMHEELGRLNNAHTARIKGGWPLLVPNVNDPNSRIYLNAADLDQDGQLEVFIAVEEDNSGRLYVFSNAGVELFNTLSAENGYPTVADLNNNGFREIIFGYFESIVVYDHLFHFQFSENIQEIALGMHGIVAADLDGDSQSEMLVNGLGSVTAQTGWVLAGVDSSGTQLPGFPLLTTPGPAVGQLGWVNTLVTPLPAVGNLDMDPDLEVAILGSDYSMSTRSCYLSVIDGDGSILPGWPVLLSAVDFGAVSIASPVTADLNGDGIDEIVAGSNNGLFVFSADGQPYPGNWPVLVGAFPDEGAIVKLMLTDIDSDGVPEIVCRTGEGTYNSNEVTVVFDAQGAEISRRASEVGIFTLTGLVSLDIDGKNHLVTTENRFSGFDLVVWDPVTGAVVNSQFISGYSSFDTPIVGDLDDDGSPELLVSAWGLVDQLPWVFNFDLSHLTTFTLSDWTMEHGGPERTGHYRPPCIGDLNSDSIRSELDLWLAATSWTEPNGPADFNGDSSVDVIDYIWLISQLGSCPQ